MADAPPPEPITPALIEAAKKEGKVSYYTSTDLPVAEKLPRRSRRNIPALRSASSAPGGAGVSAHRPGIWQQHPCGRRGEFVGRRAFHRLETRRHPGALRAGRRRKVLPTEHKDVDGQFASWRVWLSIIATTPVW